MLVLDKDPVWITPKRGMVISWSERYRSLPWSRWKERKKVLNTGTMYEAKLALSNLKAGYVISGAEHCWLPKELFNEDFSTD